MFWIKLIRGEKRVRLWAVGTDLTTIGGEGFRPLTLASSSRYKEVMLRDGDVLFCPARMPHAVHTTQAALSVSANHYPRTDRVRKWQADAELESFGAGAESSEQWASRFEHPALEVSFL